MIKKVLLYLWQAPQNFLGFLLTRKPKYVLKQFSLNDETKTKIYFTKNVFNCGVSLGNYIILDADVYYRGCLSRSEE